MFRFCLLFMIFGYLGKVVGTKRAFDTTTLYTQTNILLPFI